MAFWKSLWLAKCVCVPVHMGQMRQNRVPLTMLSKPVEWSIQKLKSNSDLFKCTVKHCVSLSANTSGENGWALQIDMWFSWECRQAKENQLCLFQDDKIALCLKWGISLGRRRWKHVLKQLFNSKNWGHHWLLAEGWRSRNEREKWDEIVTFLHQEL